MIKFKIGKHWFMKALVGVALVATIGFSPHNRVLAGGGGKPDESGNLGVKGGRPDVHVDDDGNVIFETNDKAATNTDSTLLFLYKC